MDDDLTTARFSRPAPPDHRDVVQYHVETLADRLKEAFRVVRENNQLGRDRQKTRYDHGTKLTVFQPGERIYLREMVKSKRGASKFRLRWKGPYEVVRRLSDLNYLIKVTGNKEIVVNVNKMKKCHNSVSEAPPLRGGMPTEATERQNTAREVTSPIPSDHGINIDGFLYTQPATTDEEDRGNGEDEAQATDPTWNPGGRQEISVDDGPPPDGEEPKGRYWLRSRQREHSPEGQATHQDEGNDEAEADVGEDDPTTDATAEESAVPTQRYNLRPLPGRRIP
jgi:hypothetical protein